MKEPKRLVENSLENVITQIPDDSLAEVRNHTDRAVFSYRFHCGGADEQSKKDLSVQGRYAEPRIDKRDRDGRDRGGAEQRIENQSDEKRRDGLQHSHDRNQAE